MVLSDVLEGHIIPLIALFAEIWNTHGKSLRAQVIYINSAKQNQAQYTPQESIISKFTKKPKGSSAQHKPYIESSKSRNLFKSIIYKTQPNWMFANTFYILISLINLKHSLAIDWIIINFILVDSADLKFPDQVKCALLKIP